MEILGLENRRGDDAAHEHAHSTPLLVNFFFYLSVKVLQHPLCFRASVLHKILQDLFKTNHEKNNNNNSKSINV